jgi:hypothetical protein
MWGLIKSDIRPKAYQTVIFITMWGKLCCSTPFGLRTYIMRSGEGKKRQKTHSIERTDSEISNSVLMVSSRACIPLDHRWANMYKLIRSNFLLVALLSMTLLVFGIGSFRVFIHSNIPHQAGPYMFTRFLRL